MKRKTNDTPVPGRHLRGKHTPGPWTAHLPKEKGKNWEIKDQYGNTVSVYGEGEEAKANALLISAAPELLALVRAFALTDPHGPQARACQQAILKTGVTAP